MMWHSILYVVLLVTCVPYALLRGGAPERIGAIVALLATILSGLALAGSAIVYAKAEIGAFVVDAAALAAFLAVALVADRYWPLIVAGLQADAVMIHLCKLLEPDILPLGYAIGLSIWSYPILILLAIGTRRHRRRLAAHGLDPSWSSFGRGPRSLRDRSAYGDSLSHSDSITFKGKSGAGGSSKRINHNGSVKTVPTTSNGGVR